MLLLEADRLAGGQTRNTTAKITAQHGMIYERLSEQKGELAARQYASANQRAVEAYRRLVRERKIPCEWEDCPAFLYSTQEEDPVRQEAHTAARLGLECSFTLETELPFPVKGRPGWKDRPGSTPFGFWARWRKSWRFLSIAG